MPNRAKPHSTSPPVLHRGEVGTRKEREGTPRKLPPLNPLRAFEASGRLLSFTRAADELCVTQAAVSRQVQALEQYLGVRLFQRLTRELRLTQEGELLLPVVADCFGRLVDIADRLRNDRRREALALRLPPYLSARWLVPKLGAFIEAHPDVHFRLSHSTGKPDFSDGATDLIVYWGEEEWPGLVNERFLTLRRVPMCSPALLRSGVLRGPEDLKSFMLLHEFDHQDWRNWFNSVGMPPSDAERGTVVDNYEVLVEAAVDGQGIALIAVPLLVDHLEAGRLVPPFGPHLGIDLYYNLLYPKAALSRPIVAAFREWLLSLVLAPEPRSELDQPHSSSRIVHANGTKANGPAGDRLTERVG